MDITEALAREESWRQNPQTRPQPSTAKMVAATLAARIEELEHQVALLQRLVVGRKVTILRGNSNRGPETGPGFGRKVAAIVEEAPVGRWDARCRLLEDDPHAVGRPCRAGESGHWSISQITVELEGQHGPE